MQTLFNGDTSIICRFGRFCPSEAGTGNKSAAEQIENIFTMVFGFFTIIAGLGFFIYFLIGGLKWLTSGGDTQKVDTAKKTMTSALVGIIIIVSAYGIIWLVGNAIGLNILSVQELIGELTGNGNSSTPVNIPTPAVRDPFRT